MIQQVKDFLNFVDIIVGTFWGFTLMEVVPVLSTGTTIVFTQLDNVIKVAFAFVGLIYTIIRMLHFIKKSKQDLRFREQEIIEKQYTNRLKDKENGTS